jgi:redox-regulated HSP33 family molecular chaperone
VKQTIRILPRAEVEDVLKSIGMFEAKCDFCGTMYRLSVDDTRAVMDEAQ